MPETTPTHLALLAREPGRAAEVLDYVEVDTPEPAAGQVRVHMLTTTANPSDLITISGAYASRTTYPFVGGFEGLGIVDEVADVRDEELLGARVLPLGGSGNWQEYRVLDAKWCVPVPEDIDDESATFAFINPLTALLLVESQTAAVAGGTVVLTAGSSQMTVDLAELLRPLAGRIIGLTTGRGTPRRPELFDALVDVRSAGWEEEFATVGGGEASAVFDSIGGPLSDRLLALTPENAPFVQYGLLSGISTDQGGLSDARRAAFSFFHLRERIYAMSTPELHAAFDRVFEHIREGRLHSTIDRSVGFIKLRGTLDAVASGRGKVLVRF